MAEEFKPGCARPTGGPTVQNIQKETEEIKIIREERTMIKVGQKAPDFTAPAFHKDKFINVKLSDYLGKWVVICFYPGDFTFV